MKALVVDNEDNILRSVMDLIAAFCPEITSIHGADGVQSGKQAILSLQPDIVFLDVELNDGKGMDLMAFFPKPSFHVVFITAHQHYAIDAFRFSAIDFLLKPIQPEELMRSIERIRERKQTQNAEQIELLREIVNTTNYHNKKIVLRDIESIYFVKIENIIRCEADRSYTTFIFANQPRIVVSKGLKEYEELLAPYGFFRVHHSHLINLSKVKRYDRVNGGSLIMENNDEVFIAQRKKDQILDLFKHL